jgi:FMN phosphatase YigB (HAD superfamily)
MIRAVVLDIGSVLEVIDDAVFPEPFEKRHGLAHGAVLAAFARLEGHPGLGGCAQAEMWGYVRRELDLDDRASAELAADFWRWYVGTLDQELYHWFAAKRPALRTGIISNSNPGAREAERCWGFEAITDDIVYSHEVGLMKPDPKIFLLGAHRLGVLPSEVVFLDDVEGHVAAAREVGFHGVVHRSTPESIREVDRIIAEEERT